LRAAKLVKRNSLSFKDGSDIGGWLAQLFQVLNTPEDKRPRNLDADLAKFPYVNGALFADGLLIPSFDSDMRQRLIDAGRFDWSGISPAIFGSLFQSVMNAKERRAAGVHFTYHFWFSVSVGHECERAPRSGGALHH